MSAQLPGTLGWRDDDPNESTISNEDIDISEGVEVIQIPYEPRPFQAVLHNKMRRFNLLVCHRRFGKTIFSVMEMIDRALRNPSRNPQYAYLAPNYGQAKRVAWDYFKYYCSHIPNAKANEAELRIDITREHEDGSTDRIRFMLLGAENPDSLRGIYLDGVTLDEYADMSPEVWGKVIRPALSDRKGWAIFIGTPKGQNHFFDMLQRYQKFMDEENDRYFCAIYKASETGVLDEEELEDAKATSTEEEYMQEYECDFTAALIGAYYGKYIKEMEEDGRICDFDYDPNFPVCTAWDLGISDSNIIWFYQIVGREIRILDYIEENGKGLEHYAQELQTRGYIYDPFGHALPHDGAARELGTGKTRQEQLENFGIRTTIVPKQSVADGIHSVRMLLKKPTTFIHKTKCKRGIDALKNYQRQYDRRKGIFLDKPLHNWASHGADGFRMLALSIDLPDQAIAVKIKPEYRQAQMDYDEFDY